MKNLWLLTTLLIGSLLLTGCNTTVIDWDNCKDWTCNEVNNEVVDEVNNEVSNDTSKEKKTELTLEDFDYINQNLMPKSYHYELTNHVTDRFISEWNYEYKEDDHSVLEPPYVVKKEVTESKLYENVVLETTIKYTFEDWSYLEVTYFNDPYTLKYISAISFQGQTTSNYTFNY